MTGPHFLDLVTMPFLLLIAEYLGDEGLCKCNRYENNIYNLSITNKEIYNHLKKYNKLSLFYPEKKFPINYQNYFKINSYCSKHMIISNSEIDKVIVGIKNLERNKDDNLEFIHCTSYPEVCLLKKWISKYTILEIKRGECCGGTGFPITLPIKGEKRRQKKKKD